MEMNHGMGVVMEMSLVFVMEMSHREGGRI